MSYAIKMYHFNAIENAHLSIVIGMLTFLLSHARFLVNNGACVLSHTLKVYHQ
jgi:hypothetical protein